MTDGVGPYLCAAAFAFAVATMILAPRKVGRGPYLTMPLRRRYASMNAFRGGFARVTQVTVICVSAAVLQTAGTETAGCVVYSVGLVAVYGDDLLADTDWRRKWKTVRNKVKWKMRLPVPHPNPGPA